MPRSTYDAHETPRMHALHGRELAPFQRRAAALLIDLGIGAVLFLAIVLVVVYAVSGHPIVRGTVGKPQEGTIQVGFFNNWLSVVWWVVYFGLATYLGNGRTPGKRLMKIRVVSLVHERITLWHSIERALGYGASALEFGFGFLQYFLNGNRRTVHDRIAETIVVKEA
jgi:uncharacterized RDD family membrane protein YckC